jgi:hypothetical protein
LLEKIGVRFLEKKLQNSDSIQLAWTPIVQRTGYNWITTGMIGMPFSPIEKWLTFTPEPLEPSQKLIM